MYKIKIKPTVYVQRAAMRAIDTADMASLHAAMVYPSACAQ
jgi:hypothetical protein